jgi:hypothetical protein
MCATHAPLPAVLLLLLLLLLQVRVVCPGVFVAAIGISPPGSLQPVRVCVDSVDKASTVDPWTSSKHQVCVGTHDKSQHSNDHTNTTHRGWGNQSVRIPKYPDPSSSRISRSGGDPGYTWS